MRDVVGMEVQRLDGTRFIVKGREAWTLKVLIEAGLIGITPLERPAPRWSSYVHKLRKRGLDIETQREGHDGAYAGRHGRYVLKTPLALLRVAYADQTAQTG